MRSRPSRLSISLVTFVVLALTMALPASARPEMDRAMVSDDATFAVYHDAVEAPLMTAGSDGHQLGDVRTASAQLTDADGATIGRLDATLTTTALDIPEAGDEHRLGVLVFSFGDDLEHQLTVHGVAHYPAQGSTIAIGDAQVRPVVGGSGRFAGARGEAVTTHLEDGAWVHAFHLDGVRGDRDRARAARAEARAARKAERAEEKAARKAEKAARKSDTGDEHDDVGLAGGAIDALYANVPDDGSGVVRTDLGLYDPPAAPGQQLGLWHYLIPAGQELAPHTHPGIQLARVMSGELEYTVDSGEGLLLRADGGSQPMPPGTYILAPGDGVIENPEMVHFGANRGDDPVTLISATLYEAGAPLSTVVELPVGEPLPME